MLSKFSRRINKTLPGQFKLQHGQKAANFAMKNARVLALGLTSGYLMYQNIKSSSSSWKTKFLAPTPTNTSMERIFQGIQITSFDNMLAFFKNAENNVESEQVIILMNPKFFNDNFLGELAQSLNQLQ